MDMCSHADVVCVNPYELIRKYRCRECGEVMMCACEESFARRFLPHQLDQAVELETQKRIPVTLGFQERICNSCRGLPEEPHPKAETYGRGSKIIRYYWREIFFEVTERFASWAEANGYKDSRKAQSEFPDKFKRIRRAVIQEMKKQHTISPKYEYQEVSQDEVLKKYDVEVVRLEADYVDHLERGVRLRLKGKLVSAEDFVAVYFRSRGLSVLFMESRPLHALFGTMMFLLIQDFADPLVRMVGFGDRAAFEEGKQGARILTYLPTDFGTQSYAARRSESIESHLAMLPRDVDEMVGLFDYWTGPSSPFRQYLWAHRTDDVEKARQLLDILPVDIVVRILRYLVGHYWGRYLGWPDLLVYNEDGFFFTEVKSSRDKLSEDQKNWIRRNSQILDLPFKLVKIHRKAQC